MEMMYNEELELGKRLMAEHHPAIELHDISVLQGGKIKTVWKLETSIGTLCLKRIGKPLPIVKFTTAAQAYLAGKGALVAGIIPTKDNELFFVHEGYGLVLYEWIHGSDLLMEKNPDHLYTGVKGLAQFYKDNTGFVPPDDCETYNRMGILPGEYGGMRDDLFQWKSEAQKETTPYFQLYLQLTDDMIRMVEQSIQLLNDSCYSEWVASIGDYGYLVHQDYGKGNALETGHGVYILDLDNLAYDTPVRDLSKLMTKRMRKSGRWDYDEIVRIMDRFTSVFPLTDGQRRILYIDMLCPLKFHSYAKDIFIKHEEGEEEKLLKVYRGEMEKLPVLYRLLGI